MLFKVEFEKTYDLVDWNYLDVISNFVTKVDEEISRFDNDLTFVLVDGSPIDEF